MKIEAVKLMRNMREKINSDIEGFSWSQESEYLRKHIQSFPFITKKSPNKTINSDPLTTDLN